MDEIKPIREIEFSILSNEDIKKGSCFRNTKNEKYEHGIEIQDLYDKQEPKRGSLIDQRMGASGDNLCATCQFDIKYCDGHPAHIDLAEPVFNILYIDYLKGILECICIQCSSLLISKENDKLKHILQIKSNKNRFIKIHELAGKAKFCLNPHKNCGGPVSKIKVEIKKSTSTINIYSEHEIDMRDNKGKIDKKKQRLNLTASHISDIFDNISDEDCMILGSDPTKCKPSDMIHKTFHVPPIHVRPSLRGYFSSGTPMVDGLTLALAPIVRANNRINKQRESNNENTNKYSKDHAQLLQLYVATYYNPEKLSNPKNDGKMVHYKSLTDRYKGKGGRIRSNLMGKRGNFNARTVITPDPTISINGLGVPIKIAMVLTFPEYVTQYNYDKLTQLVRNGPDVYPGANYVYKIYNNTNTNKPIQLKYRKDTIVLQYGDIVERHIQNDDIVLVNRQPTLHKHGMMSHKIQIIPDTTLTTFRLSPAITQPYAGDFDGDEMNIFAPQTIQTQFELEEITDVKKQLISPARSTIIYGVIEDSIVGSFNLTDERTKINWREAMNIMSYTTFDDFKKIEKNKTYKGSDLFSMIIPSRITLNIENNIDIKNGIIIAGKIKKDVISAGTKNNLLHNIWDEYGENASQAFIDNIQRIGNNFNMLNGFTGGIKDITPQQTTIIETKKYIEHVINGTNIDLTNIENNPTHINMHNFEMKLRSDLNVIRDDVSKMVASTTSKNNNFMIMIKSGSKGSVNNLGQIMGCVGFQEFEGGLMPKMYNNRTLCYFHENDDRPKSRGLCTNSYMNGLTFSEFCFHTKAGRTGLIVQAVKTADTGYAQRKLIKTMEDAMIKYDGTLRLANNQIIQQTYGGNGNNTVYQYEYSLKMLNMDNDEIKHKYMFTQNELTKFKDFTNNDNIILFETILNMRDLIRKNIVKSSTEYKILSTTFMISVNLTRIMSLYEISNTTEMTPKYIIDSIENLLHISNTPIVKISQNEKNKNASEDDYATKITFRAALYDILNPKEIYNKMSKNTFDIIIDNIKTQFNNNIIEPGDMVGCVAAQSLGEAVTQLTISSFHQIGIASKTQSTGAVPRINELLSATKHTKHPHMMVYLLDEIKSSKTHAQIISQTLEKTTFGKMCDKIEIYYDPSPYDTNSIMKIDGITEPFYNKKLSHNSCSANIKNLPWLFRVYINKDKMLTKNISLLDIKAKFCTWWEKKHFNAKKKKEKTLLLKKITSFAMLSNNDNDDQPFVHIRFNIRDNENKKGKFNRSTLYEFADLIENFKLKGINNVDTVDAISKERCIDITNNGALSVGEEYCIYTSGVNLQQIRYIKGINHLRTYTDNVYEMFKTFGIEHARNKLITEFLSAYGSAGSNGINPQHVTTLVDIMCYSGSILSADRNGMKNAKIDPLAKASFEKPIDILIRASVFNDIDKMQSVSSRLYIGSVFKGGTGYCDIILDTEMIQNSEYIETPTVNTTTTINTLANSILGDIENDDDDIFIPL